MRNNKKVNFIDNLLKGQKSYFDIYFEYLKKADNKGAKILHLGCGWDKRNIRDRIKFANLYSMDIDFGVVSKNRNSFKVCGDAHKIPLKKNSFDFVICEDLIEHIEFPEELLKELHYILKKNGEFVFVTPGGWSYIAIVSKLTPLGFHEWYNRKRGVDVNDIYPAFYRFNSKFKIKRESFKHGFNVKKIVFITGYPSYFNFSRTLTVLFGYCHYFVSKVSFLNNIFGINIFCVLNKK